MAKKSKSAKPKRPMSKRQLSRWQELKKRQVMILIGGITIIAAVVMMLGIGWFVSSYQPLRQTVIRVNNAEFDLQYFIDMLRLQIKGQSTQNIQILAQNLPKSIEHNELMRQAAAALGVTVSDDEISESLNKNKLPNTAVYRDLMRVQSLATKLREQYFEKQVPTESAQVNMQAMLLESEAQASDFRARVEKGESFGDLAKQWSLEGYSKTHNGDIGWHPQDVLKDLLSSSVPGDYAFGSPAGTLSQARYDADIPKQVGYWIIKVIKKSGPDQADIYAMLLGSQDEAQTVRVRLVNGEDFASIAKDQSQLNGAKDNGGNVGTVSKNSLTPAVDDFLFNANTKDGNLSDPLRDTTVSTKGGYWLIKVLEKADKRLINEQDRETMKQAAFNQWAGSLWINPDYKIDEFLDQSQMDWAIQQASKP